jgi:uncharacterized protein YjlB
MRDFAMPTLEDAKRAGERITGWGRPRRRDLPDFTRKRKPHLFRFEDDGETPNNPHWPMVLYRSPVVLTSRYDPAAILEDLFAKNGWTDSWRDGIYGFLHFHTHTHEVLGIARGAARVQFGGGKGRMLDLKTGDVVVQPAGTGHRRLKASRDFLVVGAYPATSGRYDEPKPSQVDRAKAVASIAKVRLPRADPVYGKDGPLLSVWKKHGWETRRFH